MNAVINSSDIELQIERKQELPQDNLEQIPQPQP